MPARQAAEPRLAVREWTPADVPSMVGYFLDADPDFLALLGVDPEKLPARQAWIDAACTDLARPVQERERFYLVWEVDGIAIGHSNLSDIDFGRVANMHLHIWDPSRRRRGSGRALVRASIDRYFEIFRLDTLLCEPHALNPAPNRTLPFAGFELVETYHGIPGAICYPQEVNRWRLTRRRWMERNA